MGISQCPLSPSKPSKLKASSTPKGEMIRQIVKDELLERAKLLLEYLFDLP